MPSFSMRRMWRPVVRPVTVTWPFLSTETPWLVKPLKVILSVTVERATVTVQPSWGVKL